MDCPIIDYFNQGHSTKQVGQDQPASISAELAGNFACSQKKNENLRLALKLAIANKEIAYLRKEREKRSIELIAINKTLFLRNQDRRNRAAELVIANKELAYQNS